MNSLDEQCLVELIKPIAALAKIVLPIMIVCILVVAVKILFSINEWWKYRNR